jgi:outer membrane receptor for ferrienterochelin and colicin
MAVLETRLSQVTSIVAVAEEDEEMRTLRLSIKTTDGREIMASTVEEALKTQPLVVDATPQEQLASNEATNIQIIQAVPPVDAQEVQ